MRRVNNCKFDDRLKRSCGLADPGPHVNKVKEQARTKNAAALPGSPLCHIDSDAYTSHGPGCLSSDKVVIDDSEPHLVT